MESILSFSLALFISEQQWQFFNRKLQQKAIVPEHFFLLLIFSVFQWQCQNQMNLKGTI
jgi:hypothetical protein